MYLPTCELRLVESKTKNHLILQQKWIRESDGKSLWQGIPMILEPKEGINILQYTPSHYEEAGIKLCQ